MPQCKGCCAVAFASMKVAMAEPSLKTRPTFSPDTASMPLSPHLQIWRWTVTMATSITHRATGIALYAGSILLALWLLAAAVGERFYAPMSSLLGSPLGLLILVGFSWAISFHLCNGIKYLFWDAGNFLEKGVAKKVAWIVYIASVVLTAVIWALALGMKG